VHASSTAVFDSDGTTVADDHAVDRGQRERKAIAVEDELLHQVRVDVKLEQAEPTRQQSPYLVIWRAGNTDLHGTTSERK
jgi:hypothetical protein